MHQRGFLFTTTLILLALIMTAPFLCFGGLYGWACYEAEELLPLDSISPFEWIPFDSQIGNPDWAYQTPTLVQDQLYWSQLYTDESSSWRAQISSADPETGVVTSQNTVESQVSVLDDQAEVEFVDHHYFVGDSKRMWMLDRNHAGQIFEKLDSGFVARFPKLADGTAVPGFYQKPESNYGVVLAGRLTIFVETSYGKLEVFQLDENLWRPLGKLKLLDTTRTWRRPDGQLLFQALAEVADMPKTRFAGFNLNTTLATATSITTLEDGTRSIPFSLPTGGTAQLSLKKGTIEMRPYRGRLRIVAHDSECHLFWGLPDRLLYRRGWELEQTISAEDDIQNWTMRDDHPISALEPRNFGGESSEWMTVTPLNKSFATTDATMATLAAGPNTFGCNFSISTMARIQEWFPAFVDGYPVVITIKRSSQSHGHQIAQALRFDGTRWSEFASMELPYGAQARHSGARSDGSVSYLTTTTPLGRNRLVALESTGFRLTKCDQYIGLWGLDPYLLIAVLLCFSLLAGMVLGSYATLLMWRDRARYEFGIQSVELASLFERGVARTVDFVLIMATMTALFGTLMVVFQLNWRTALEALYENDFDQPELALGNRLMLASFGAGVGGAMVFILLQGVFGVTPGKWICGLRTLRATLKPCGIARSLLRDVLLCIDTLNLCCWYPGIFFVAFTQFRQRIGDLVADTLVVRAISLSRTLPADLN